MVAHSGLITVMQRAAHKAAPRLRRDFGEVEQLQVSRKGPADFVSMADKRAEQTILEELRNARPDWGILAEEFGPTEGNPAKPRWIVDPLDGTTNFLHGIPHFSISIAVEEQPSGRPARDHAWPRLSAADGRRLLGRKGQGSLAPGPPLRSSARRDLDETALGLEFRIAVAAIRPAGQRFTPQSAHRFRACAGSAQPLLIWPGWLLVEWMASGKTTSIFGTPQRAFCSFVKLEDS